MAESNSKLPAPLQKFVTDLREKLIKTETQIRELRAREASTKTQTLAKHELCPLCGGPDRDARCACVEKLQKNAVKGYADSTPGSGLPSNTGMGSIGGGGTAPMGKGEKDPKKGTCKECGGKGGKHNGHLVAGLVLKCKNDPTKMQKDDGTVAGTTSLSKKTPEGISEKTMHKLKDEYGHDKEGKSKAYATANAIASGTVNHKAEMKTTPHLDDAKLAKMGMPSSSAAALAPAAPKPATSVGQANKEMGGFKSLASSPTGPAARPAPMPKAKFNVGNAGRGNPATASAAGMIPTAKAEKNPGSASKYGTGGPGHATQANMPSALKANMAPIKKDEKELAPTPAAPEKKVEGAKMPEAGKSVDAKKTGAGGQVKKEASLKKAAAAEAAQPVVGVSGKQPVGKGGGDAFKAPGGGAKLPGPGGSKGPVTGTKGVAVHPDTTASLAAVKGMKPSVQSQAKGKANVQQLRGKLAEVAAKKPLPSVDVDVSDFDAGPAKGGALQAAGNAEVGRLKQPDSLQNVRDQMNVKADKRAGGVGFLNSLIRMFRPLAPATGQQGSLTSQRFHGALPLQRGEMTPEKHARAVEEQTKKMPPAMRGVMGGGPKHENYKDPDPKQAAKSAEMKKAALALTKKDLDDDELDKGLSMNHSRKMLSCKAEMPSPEMGLSGVNHSRRMLAVTRQRRAKKNR